MKSLGIAIGIVIAVAALLFGIVHAFGVTDKVAGPLAGSALGFITFIHDNVDKALSSGRSRVTPGVVPVTEFDIRWPLMVVYGTLIVVGIFEMTDFLFSFPVLAVAGLNKGMTEQMLLGLLGIMSLPTIGWSIFLLGRWMGIRSSTAGYWILPLCLVMGRGLDVLFTVILFPSARSILMMGLSYGTVVMLAITGLFILLSLLGMFGVWRGNRIRFGAYFNSLLNQVSASTRDTMLALTFEEAKAAHSGTRPT